MFKYFNTKNIENYKYEISVLKNKEIKNKNEKDMINNSEKVIQFSKYFCRFYFGIEVLNFFNIWIRNKKIMINKLAFAYLRINLIWIMSNLFVNYYLEKHSGIHKLSRKYKSENKIEFSQFIENKI